MSIILYHFSETIQHKEYIRCSLLFYKNIYQIWIFSPKVGTLKGIEIPEKAHNRSDEQE